ncbi:PREDICTED: protein SMAX1-LIKE 7-like [Tarenaya hassleriana]|uniref:protein SMAX1-LIKE 7-like n=1 Tax=Tarenaya hassleriana TaxID=28532 RepID=UPI00053C6AA6|nr:PREDICTED: protein SMAX1-LIKE 7-like [Tarenaya hassleriana]
MAALQKKWDDVCQRIHQSPAFPKFGFQPSRPEFSVQLVRDQFENVVRRPTEQISGTSNLQIPSPSRLSVQVSKPKHNDALTSPMTNCTTSSPLSCVTTDLGLGTIYASSNQEPKTPISLDKRDLGASSEKSRLLTQQSCAELINPKDFKSLKELLSQKVSWQSDAVNAISEILCGCKEGSWRSHGGSSRNVWLALLGPDRVGKKKIASALAEIFFNGQENFISADFQAQDCLDDKFRGKTVVDYVAGELARHPHSVLFLENVEKAEFPDQISLSDAVRTGKLRNSHGREISMKNVIVVVTSGDVKDSNRHVLDSGKFSEERMLSAKSCRLQIKLSETARTSLNKRKQDSETETVEARAQKAQRSFLDLNLPVEETEADTEETVTMSENTKAWLDDFVGLLDDKVMFKPVDFDGLAKNIQRSIISTFRRSFGSEIEFEMDDEVIVQILAGSWLSDEDRTLDQWLHNVLAPRFVEARQKYGSTPGFAVKLAAVGGLPAEEQAAGGKFPARVDVL